MTGTIQKVETPEATGIASWVRTARYGALTVTVWAVALHLFAGELIPPVAVLGLVFAVLAFFLRGERRKPALVAAILGVLAVMGNLPATIDELAHPESAPAFILTLLAVVGALVVVVAGWAAFRGWSAEPVKGVAISAAAVFAAGVLVSVVASLGVESAAAMPADVVIVAENIEFDPGALVIDAGNSGFWVENRDGIRHTFTIEGLGLEINIPALSSQRADFDLDPGRYEVFCAVPGHENMKIDLTVES